MSNTEKKVLIFTDLDGTLLDHHTYSYEAAADLLEALHSAGIPVIPVSSKTRTELTGLCAELNLGYGYVAENGALACVPNLLAQGEENTQESSGDCVCEAFTKPAEHWQDMVREMGFEYEFTTFSASSMEEIAALTGLDYDSAENAMNREYGEVLCWQYSPGKLDALALQLARRGATVTRGGRFVHVTGRVDKGRAMDWVVAHYTKSLGIVPNIVAAGDAENDIPMLARADVSVVVRSPVNGYPGWDLTLSPPGQRVIHTEKKGPAGWRDGMILALKQIGVPLSLQPEKLRDPQT